jgi:heme exporter protein A
MPEGGAALATHADGVKAALTVAENLRFWAGLHGRPWDEGPLRDFDLMGLRDRPAGTLSAGQARRLGLARLGVVSRPVLLLDEPTVSLDAGSAGLLETWLLARLAEGAMAVIATHAPLGLDAPELDLRAFRSAASDAFL